ncbi:hypothetical protein ABXS71_10275 [Bacillus infantis]
MESIVIFFVQPGEIYAEEKKKWEFIFVKIQLFCFRIEARKGK